MAKRFIDTGLFDDEWFSSLSSDGKIAWIYCITKCDHAGIIKINERLFTFQTGIKSWVTVSKELGKSLVTVNDSSVYFIPKFLEFQYPNFPQSTVRQQDGAIKILKQYGLWDEELNSYLRVSKELPNSYVNDTGNGNGNGNGLSNTEPQKPKKSKADKAVLFQDSPVAKLEDFKKACPEDWGDTAKEFWYHKARDYSLSKGAKYVDWIAAVRNWARSNNEQQKPQPKQEPKPTIVYPYYRKLNPDGN